MKIDFNPQKITEQLVTWLQNWFETNGKDCKAVIGISGGKDSTIAAALCVKALGADRVFGVLMPNGEQADLQVAEDVCNRLGIEHVIVNIQDAYTAIKDNVTTVLNNNWSEQSDINLPARLRMSTLYAVSQTVNGRVINTCNLSEDWIGYSTRYGDSVGDVSPLSHLTVTEVKAIGYCLGIPERFIEKIPSDGLCGQTDEEKLGFSYKTLDDYIRYDVKPEPSTKVRIDYLHEHNKFKLRRMPSFMPNFYIKD